MLTVKAAAALVPTSPSLVYQWCGERRFPVYRVGGRGKRGKILIDEAEVRAFLEALRVGAEQPAAPRPPRARLNHIGL